MSEIVPETYSDPNRVITEFNPNINVMEFIKKVKPYDLIVFTGTDFVSDAICKYEESREGCGSVSHVGMWITKKECSKIKCDNSPYFIWESTQSGWLGGGPPNIETGKSYFGPQLRSAHDVLAQYKGKVGWAPLLKCPEVNPEIVEKFYDEYHEAIYDFNVIDLIAAVDTRFRKLRKYIHWIISKFRRSNARPMVFCSEFVATFYQRIGIIPEKDIAENYTPVDIAGIGDSIPIVAPIKWITFR